MLRGSWNELVCCEYGEESDCGSSSSVCCLVGKDSGEKVIDDSGLDLGFDLLEQRVCRAKYLKQLEKEGV